MEAHWAAELPPDREGRTGSRPPSRSSTRRHRIADRVRGRGCARRRDTTVKAVGDPTSPSCGSTSTRCSAPRSRPPRRSPQRAASPEAPEQNRRRRSALGPTLLGTRRRRPGLPRPALVLGCDGSQTWTSAAIAALNAAGPARERSAIEGDPAGSARRRSPCSGTSSTPGTAAVAAPGSALTHWSGVVVGARAGLVGGALTAFDAEATTSRQPRVLHRPRWTVDDRC